MNSTKKVANHFLQSQVQPFIKMDAVKHLSGLLSHTASSDAMYMTQELFSKLASVHVALELFTLDAEIHKGDTEFTLVKEVEPVVINIIQNLHEYRSYFEATNVAKLQENEIRRLHKWGLDKLQCFVDQLDPLARRAQRDIDDYSDKIGTTDRFTGYRNMLNRGSRDAFRLGQTSVAKDHNGGYNDTFKTVLNTQRLDKNFPDVRTSGCSSIAIANNCAKRAALNSNLDEMEKQPKNMIKLDVTKEGRTPAEEAGINIVYPGTTEYCDRYVTPVPNPNPSPFTINPSVDFEKQFGRKVAVDPWMIPESEYEFSYKYPTDECDKRLPWEKM